MTTEIESGLAAALDIGERSTHVNPRVMWVGRTGDDNTDVVPVALEQRSDSTDVTVLTSVLEELDRRSPAPRRRHGFAVLAELASFIAYVNRFKQSESTVYADCDAFKLTAVFNDTPPGASPSSAAWRDHGASYVAPRSAEWKAWTEQADKPMAQDAFADFLEARLEDLTTGDGFPAPTEMLKLARDLHVLTKGTFQRTINPTNGTSTLVCKTEADTGSTVIPRAFLLAIPVFEMGARYQVEARVRMQLEGRPLFSFTLHRRKEIERDAFNECRTAVAEQTTLPIFAGKP